jgi:ATP-dependent DNA helicase RecG
VDLPFDAQPLQSASFDDLDLRLLDQTYLHAAVAPEVLAADDRSIAHELAALGFATVDGTPTVAGMITVGHEPSRFIPGAYVQFLRIDGVALSDPIVGSQRIVGPLPDVFRELHQLFRRNTRPLPLDIGHADYPLVALEQLTRNAIMHRTYEFSNAPVRVTWFSDRVEIQNPGALYGNVTVDTFGSPGVTDYRNPAIAEAMRQLGHAHRAGVGVEMARRDLSHNGNPAPDFRLEPTYVAVTIGSAQALEPASPDNPIPAY